MKTATKEKIIAYIRENKQARVHDLVRILNISHVAVHKQLKRLREEGTIARVGKPPLVFYVLPEEPKKSVR